MLALNISIKKASLRASFSIELVSWLLFTLERKEDYE